MLFQTRLFAAMSKVIFRDTLLSDSGDPIRQLWLPTKMLGDLLVDDFEIVRVDMEAIESARMIHMLDQS